VLIDELKIWGLVADFYCHDSPKGLVLPRVLTYPPKAQMEDLANWVNC
jgi:hypothetical protein